MAGKFIEDRWRTRDALGAAVPSRDDGKGARWRARYKAPDGREHARRFARKVDAQAWLDAQTAGIVRGDHVDPRNARTTVREWCETWLIGYGSRRVSTVRQARVHVALIVKEFGDVRLADVRPSMVRAWTAKLADQGYAPSTVYATYRRLAQIMGDAAHDGLIGKSPCSRRTAPKAPGQRPYVPTTEQVWSLVDTLGAGSEPGLRSAALLGAFAGLRIAEVSALRVVDVDFMRGVVTPAIQWPGEPLKSETSRTPVPIPGELSLELSRAVGEWTVVADAVGQPIPPWRIERAVRAARASAGLPEDFRFHDLRHYFASLLIASGADVKVVQKRLRHGSATTTLNTYAHMWPDSDETSRAAVAAVFRAREGDLTAEVASAGADTFTETSAL